METGWGGKERGVCYSIYFFCLYLATKLYFGPVHSNFACFILCFGVQLNSG